MTPTEAPNRRFRVDSTVLADLCAIIGAGMIIYGLAELSTPWAWIAGGAALVAGAIITALPPKAQPDDPAPLRQKP